MQTSSHIPEFFPHLFEKWVTLFSEISPLLHFEICWIRSEATDARVGGVSTSDEREITNRQFVSLSQETKMVETGGGVSASVEKERERARAGGGITVVAVIRNERKRNGGEGDNTSTPLRPSVPPSASVRAHLAGMIYAPI